MADKIWATIEEPIRRQIEKRQRLMLQNSNYKERVTYLNKKCDIRVTPLSYDTRESYENELWRMDWLLKNPTKEYEDYDKEYDEE